MIDVVKFKPKTIYVTYIAATPEKVWQALTDPGVHQAIFLRLCRRRRAEARRRVSAAISATAASTCAASRRQWSPPRRFACTWLVEGMEEFGALPECLVSYDIEPSGEAVKLTMAEAHSWDVPGEILAGGPTGWPTDPFEPQERARDRQALDDRHKARRRA